MRWRPVCALAALALGGCDLGGTATAVFDAGPPQSVASMAPLQGTSVSGSAVFTHQIFGDNSVTLTITVAGVVPDGNHGIHIHQTPDCSSIDGESAGPHWNPLGGPEAGIPLEDQLGELGNITISGGAGTLSLTKPMWTLGDGATTDVIGHAVIMHLNPDAGARIACGVTGPMQRI